MRRTAVVFCGQRVFGGAGRGATTTDYVMHEGGVLHSRAADGLPAFLLAFVPSLTGQSREAQCAASCVLQQLTNRSPRCRHASTSRETHTLWWMVGQKHLAEGRCDLAFVPHTGKEPVDAFL